MCVVQIQGPVVVKTQYDILAVGAPASPHLTGARGVDPGC